MVGCFFGGDCYDADVQKTADLCGQPSYILDDQASYDSLTFAGTTSFHRDVRRSLYEGSGTNPGRNDS
jgi:hypothetical protein